MSAVTHVIFHDDAHLEFPMDGTIPKGTKAVLIHEDSQTKYLFIGEYLEALDEWDNVLYLMKEWEEDPYNGNFHIVDAEQGMQLGKYNTSLDAFIRAYCSAKDMKCDGDVFSVMFSGPQDSYTVEETIKIIEDAADLYELRGEKPEPISDELVESLSLVYRGATDAGHDDMVEIKKGVRAILEYQAKNK